MPADAQRFQTEEDFRRLAEPFRAELRAHCYRMLGSLHDAEDMAQEALVRAWDRRTTYEGRSTVRAWLYKIATNACLDALEKRPTRSLPPDRGPPSGPDQPPAAPVADPIWLTPAPDDWLGETTPGPEAKYTSREGVALALMAAVQLLPPKQRAVLLLRDVLGWQASEVADLLELSVAAANSALQRARATLDERRQKGWRDPMTLSNDEGAQSLVARYMRAWEDADISGLVALLREDATLSMPPLPSWYRGQESIRAFLTYSLMAGDARGRFRTRLTSANGELAVALYQLDPETKRYRPLAIQHLEIDAGRIASMTSFLDPGLFPRFHLPEAIEI
jgi:RNA polymerase sigma-70 factor, ECF subfamily